MDLCSTKILFRVASYEMAELLARTLGEQEVMEIQEGVSYGVNDVRDVVNLSMMKQIETTHFWRVSKLTSFETRSLAAE